MTRRRIFTGVALIGLVGAFAGCASTAGSNATGANELEGGVKIPTASTAHDPKTTTVNVTLGDTKGLAGPMTIDRVPRDRPRR